MAAIIIDMADFYRRRAARQGVPEARAAFSIAATRGDRDAGIIPFQPEETAEPADHRICLAVRSRDIYTVLQFSDEADGADLKNCRPEVRHIRATDFNMHYIPAGWKPLTQHYHDIFRAHAHEDLKRAGLHVTLCRPQVKAVHEVTEPGLWRPQETEPAYTVDECGWREIDRSVRVNKGDLIIEYLGGKFAHGPKQDMLRRLKPRREAAPPAPPRL
jgi:hypothetical protein